MPAAQFPQPPGGAAVGRRALVAGRQPGDRAVSPTEWSTATAQQLLSRYGVVTREVAAAEGITGGFSAVYDVLKALEDAGRIRRGYFVAGVGATQFALPAALDLLRSLREPPDEPEVVVARRDRSRESVRHDADVAGRRRRSDGGRRTTRSVGSLVMLVNGALGAYIGRGGRQLLVFLPEDEPARSTVGRGVAGRLAALARDGGLLIAEVNGVPTAEHPLAPFLVDAGFAPSAMGFIMRRSPAAPANPNFQLQLPRRGACGGRLGCMTAWPESTDSANA